MNTIKVNGLTKNYGHGRGIFDVRNGHIVNTVSRDEYSSNPTETYTFELADENEYLKCRNAVNAFISTHNTLKIKCQRRHNHHWITLNIPIVLLNEMFALMAQFKVTAMNNEAYSLEKYYINVIENMEVQ